LLDYPNQLLDDGNGAEIYNLSDLGKAIISDSKADYASGNVIANEKVIFKK
jgi:hypothetical protein